MKFNWSSSQAPHVLICRFTLHTSHFTPALLLRCESNQKLKKEKKSEFVKDKWINIAAQAIFWLLLLWSPRLHAWETLLWKRKRNTRNIKENENNERNFHNSMIRTGECGASIATRTINELQNAREAINDLRETNENIFSTVNIFNIHVAQKKKKLSRDSSGYARMCDTRECRSSQMWEEKHQESKTTTNIVSRDQQSDDKYLYEKVDDLFDLYFFLARTDCDREAVFAKFCDASPSRCVSLLVFCVWELVLFALSSR